MKTELVFQDPYFKSSVCYENEGLTLRIPAAEKEDISPVAKIIRQHSEKYFSAHSLRHIQDVTNAVDMFFSDPSKPDCAIIADLIQRSTGFSRFDIENWGLGLFKMLVDYDPDLRGYYVNHALRNSDIIKTRFGYLKRIGNLNPLRKWKEPGLISQFISGNVVGYTAILARIGFPLRKNGAAQILKLPSASSLFPLIYLKQLGNLDPELRKTIACGYWKGGDDEIEKQVIEQSDAINILSSDRTIKDLMTRAKKYHKNITALKHGHKIGIAYISRETLNDNDMLEQTLDGLVTDISAFDGGACYNVKNIYVQQDPDRFADRLFYKLEQFGNNVSNVSDRTKPLGRLLYQVYSGTDSVLSSDKHNAFVGIRKDAEFWKPDELFRYVQVMKVKNVKEVYSLIKDHSQYLQTVILSVPDEEIIPSMLIFGKAGASNIHYPGSAPNLNVFEEPHDGEFDAVRVRYNYTSRFVATNFRKNKDWMK